MQNVNAKNNYFFVKGAKNEESVFEHSLQKRKIFS